MKKNERLKEALIKGLETRQKILTDELNLYPLHSGHHLRDVVTVLAFLKGDPNAEKLIKNLPKKEEVE